MIDCVSLEVAKKLQKAGYEQNNQEHYYQWVEAHKNWEIDNGDSMDSSHQSIAAPTATQLAEELPISLKPQRVVYHLYISHWKNGWLVEYRSLKSRTSFVETMKETLPDTLGTMMVYLLENKLINPKQ